jgi:rsbT co-antagonist protein RsbR
MKNSAINIFKNNKTKILESWIEIQLQEVGLQEDLISNDELRAQSDELLNSLVNTLDDENIDKPGSPAYEPIVDVLSAISISRAKRGYSPRETGVYIFSLKDALLKELQTGIKDPGDLYAQSLKIIKVIDSFGVTTFESFIQGREDVIHRQTGEMDEISTPVIKVWDGVLALPIIGTLDSARTQTVMENLLIQIVETGSEVAILDISGVPTVDSLVAQHLMKTVSATRLMGAECIISGIRPEIAQTIVHLGIDLSSIITKATLASALKAAFSMLSIKVERKLKPARQE